MILIIKIRVDDIKEMLPIIQFKIFYCTTFCPNTSSNQAFIAMI